MICSLCGHEIAGAFIPAAYGPECGPPAPVHYQCRLREIKAHEQDRRRLERAAPALLKACRRMLANVVRYMERGGTLTAREAETVVLMQAAVALALPPSEETQ